MQEDAVMICRVFSLWLLVASVGRVGHRYITTEALQQKEFLVSVFLSKDISSFNKKTSLRFGFKS